MTVRTVSGRRDLVSHLCTETQAQQEVPYLSHTGRMCEFCPPGFQEGTFRRTWITAQLSFILGAVTSTLKIFGKRTVPD